MFKIAFGDTTVTVNTAAEMQDVLEYVRKQEADRPKRVSPMDELLRNIAGFVDENPWTHKTFSGFIESIGSAQQTVLKLLVNYQRISDTDLRRAVGVETNQQLAGVLSGLSKQAAAHNLPAREVFNIQNESESGETKKYYVIARHLLETAKENNWPLN